MCNSNEGESDNGVSPHHGWHVTLTAPLLAMIPNSITPTSITPTTVHDQQHNTAHAQPCEDPDVVRPFSLINSCLHALGLNVYHTLHAHTHAFSNSCVDAMSAATIPRVPTQHSTPPFLSQECQGYQSFWS